MKVLAINFGHDAALALFQDGRLEEFEELERASRLKHHYGVQAAAIDSFLERCSLHFSDVDVVGLSGTQGWAMPHCNAIALTRGWTAGHERVCAFDPEWAELYAESAVTGGWYVDNSLRPQGLTLLSPSAGRERFTFPFASGPRAAAAEIESLALRALQLTVDQARHANAQFLCPYSITSGSVTKPAFYVNHHAAHAAYAGFYSGAADSMVCTHDGAFPWEPFHSGGMYLSLARTGIVPLASHDLGLGFLYDAVAHQLGVGEAGKLMGLASYAVASPAVEEFKEDCLDAFERRDADLAQSVVRRIVALSGRQQQVRREAMQQFHFAMREPARAAQSAANTQHLVQSIFLHVIGRMVRAVQGAAPHVRCLDLTGGFALNCPTNTQLQQDHPALAVNPLPGSGDTGLAVGAAVLVNDMVGVVVHRQTDARGTVAAFPPSRLEHRRGEDAPRGLVRVPVTPAEVPAFIARELAAGRVLCLHRGRSEVGPRALGRRSIVAHAVTAQMRDRINAAKGREPWRPLAPICRSQDFARYFDGDPATARFMLFTARVRNGHIPAVTHVDGTARVQCIDEDDAWLFPALTLMQQAGEHPVIVNTSFNCAGEPLVETFEQAARSFRKMGFDYLVTEAGVFRAMEPAADGPR